MGILFPAYQVTLGLSILASVSVIVYVLRHHERRGARPLLLLLVGATFWSLCALLSVQFRGTPASLVWSKLWFVGVALSVLGFFLLAMGYTGQEEYVTPKTLALLLVEPIGFNLLIWIDDSLLWTVGSPSGDTMRGYVIHQGPAFYVHAAYSYLLLAAGVSLLLWFAVKSDRLYQQQIGAILVGAIAPWIGNVLFLSRTLPIDLSPVGFVMTGIATGWALLSANFLELMPIARDTVLETLDDGVIVFDRDERIVDINEAGRTVLDVDQEDAVLGTNIWEYFGESVPITELQQFHTGRVPGTVDASIDGRYYSIRTSPLYDARDMFIGTVVLIHDITDQKRRQHELEAKNERLDQFARVVSHDLRNPLNIASGHTELARETGASEHFERIDSAHDRMATLIDELLSLAQGGRQINERERVALEAEANAGWDAVDTGDATLENGTEATVEADPERLQQLFENLFRNAVEHGGNAVSVRVGTLSENGFYVEDDGQGFDSDVEESIFESGVSRRDDGTGFGLAIVQNISQAHGWDVRATNSDDGGARFEFRDVETLQGA